jgi:hypothetical protein
MGEVSWRVELDRRRAASHSPAVPGPSGTSLW